MNALEQNKDPLDPRDRSNLPIIVKPPQKDLSKASPPTVLSHSMPDLCGPPLVKLGSSIDYSLRKWKDFPVDEEILEFMNERVIIIDYSFQNIRNNVKSVQRRSPSRSIANLLDTRIGSNPVTSFENYFNILRPIFLTCDYACAFKIAKIYRQVPSNILQRRPPLAPKKRGIPTITKMAKDIQNHTKTSAETEPYKVSIPFMEVIEL